MKPSFCVPAVLFVAAAQAACFSPDLADGVIACGEAGCPPGMTCGGDGYCYSDGEGGGDGASRVVLAVANTTAPNRVYAYCDGELREVWSESEARNSGAVAWGDFDGDGLVELAAADSYDSVRLYGFTGGGLELIETEELPVTPRDLAWGDFDDDGDDDLAAAGGGDNLRVLGHDGNGHLDTWWTSMDWYEAFGIAAAHDDGRTVLAVGARDGGNTVYVSQGNGLRMEWRADTIEDTEGVSWADHDGDGDPDLAVANYGGPVRVYANRGDWFEPLWSSPAGLHEAIAASDYDGDGDADLAVGTEDGEPTLLYRNDGGDFTLAWSSPEPDNTEAVAWADVDGDGDPDLAVGNESSPSRLYENRGGELRLIWSSPHDDPTMDLAWATWTDGPDPCRL